jgi:hypothetical protein
MGLVSAASVLCRMVILRFVNNELDRTQEIESGTPEIRGKRANHSNVMTFVLRAFYLEMKWPMREADHSSLRPRPLIHRPDDGGSKHL